MVGQDQIKRLIDRAEECRVLARIVIDPSAAESYLKVADAYEALAEEERRLFAVRTARSAQFAAQPDNAAEVDGATAGAPTEVQ